jgi:hypothetical protein
MGDGIYPWRTVTITLDAAGTLTPVYLKAKYILLLSATAVTGVAIGFTGSTSDPFPPGLTIRGIDVDTFWVRNTSGAPNTIVLGVGEADIRDNRVVIDASNPLPVTLAAGSTISLTGSFGNNADGEAVKATGISEVESYPRVFNGASWDRIRGDTNGLDVQGPVAPGAASAGKPLLLGVAKASDATVERLKGDGNGNLRVRVTDNTNYMPTMDAAARRGFVTITDGTNSMPTGDTVARAIFHKITDGTNTAQVVANNSTAIGSGQTVLAGLAATAASTNSYTTGRAAAPSLDLNGRVFISGQIAAAAALAGNPVGAGGSDGTNLQWIRAQADNSAVGAAGNQTVLAGRYDSASRSLTSGNAAFQSVDATGACILGNSNKITGCYTQGSIAPTASWNVLTLEQPASATKTIYLKELWVLSPGIFTAAQVTFISIIRTTAASTGGGGAYTPTSHDPGDSLTAVGRFGTAGSVSITGSTVIEQVAHVSGTALASFQPFKYDFTNGGTTKGIVIAKTNNAGLAFQVSGAAGGASLALRLVWTEEAP